MSGEGVAGQSRRAVLQHTSLAAALTVLPVTRLSAGAASAGGQAPLALKPFCTLVTLTGEPTTIGTGGRIIIPITGGTVDGPGLQGEVLPGESWLDRRADGNVEYLVRYRIRSPQGQIIADQAQGFVRVGASNADAYSRTVHHFEAPEGAHAWLNSSLFIGRLGHVEGGRRIEVFELL